jgi:hypothetical protein
MSCITDELSNPFAPLVEHNLFSTHSALVDARARPGTVTLFTLADVALIARGRRP